MNNSKQEQILTANELTILNFLKSLAPGERTTFERMAVHVGMNERVCKKHAERLRQNGHWIVSEKNQNRLGTYLTDDKKVWEQYKQRRLKESRSISTSISKM